MKKLYNSPDDEIDMFELSSSILTLSDPNGGLGGGNTEGSFDALGGIEDMGVIIDVVDPHEL